MSKVLSNEELDNIERYASKATQGQWWIDSHGHTMMSMDDIEVIFTTGMKVEDAVRHPETGNLSSWRNDWDATFIANACPQNVLALIKRLREAEAKVASYKSNLEDPMFPPKYSRRLIAQLRETNVSMHRELHSICGDCYTNPEEVNSRSDYDNPNYWKVKK